MMPVMDAPVRCGTGGSPCPIIVVTRRLQITQVEQGSHACGLSLQKSKYVEHEQVLFSRYGLLEHMSDHSIFLWVVGGT